MKDKQAIEKLYGHRKAFNKPMDHEKLVDGLEALKTTGKKPVELLISRKAWKLLQKIREIDTSFIPRTEADIWERARIMQL